LPAQATLQAPQLVGSLRRSTHWPPQRARPPLQTHLPAAQTLSPAHAWPHAPQLVGLLVRSTHAPLQLESPAAQEVVQTPALHT
jgi:hypothetical protein